MTVSKEKKKVKTVIKMLKFFNLEEQKSNDKPLLEGTGYKRALEDVEKWLEL